MAAPQTLREFVAQLKEAPVFPLPETEEWAQHVERISVPGRVTGVTEEHYFYWLEVLPPKWINGSHFCFAEGAEPFRFFWKVPAFGYRTRQLTWDETVMFCRLARIPLPD